MNNTTEMPMNYHKILYLIEGYFIFKNIMDIVTSFMLPYSLYRTIDQIFYVSCILFCAFGIWKHNTKKVVISFFLFLSADFSLAVLTYIVSSTSSNPLPDAGMTLLSFCIVTVIWFTASVVYYKKRWSLLQ